MATSPDKESHENPLFNGDEDNVEFLCYEDGNAEDLDEALHLIKELFPKKTDDVILPIEQAQGDPNVAANMLTDSNFQGKTCHSENPPAGSRNRQPLTRPLPTSRAEAVLLIDDEPVPEETRPTLDPVKKEKFNSLDEFLQSKRTPFKESNVRDRLRLEVRRRKLWSDVMEKLSLFSSNFNWDDAACQCIQLDIKFIGEEAVDQGGVSREFFSCVFEDASRKIMIGNSENNYNTFIHDSMALEQRQYFFYGILIGLALIHGCPGPHNWCPSLSQYILKQECKFDPSQVPDLNVREKLIALSACTSVKEMDAIIADFPERFDAGYNKGMVSLEDKLDIVNKVTRHHVISTCHEEIHQVMAGLEILGVLKWLMLFPDAAMKELVPSFDLTPEAILQFMNVVYSPEGSNCKVREEDVMYNLSNFLELVEYGKVSGTQLVNLDDNEVKGVTLTLSDVLQFITGSRYFSPALQKGHIEFEHNAPEGKRLEVSTCSFRLQIPCNKRYTESSAVFARNIAEDIISGPGFGKV